MPQRFDSYFARVEGNEAARCHYPTRLATAGYDAAVRLSPFVPEWQDLDKINSIACDKAIVEFLRVNTWIRRWLENLRAGVDLSRHTLHHGGYDHLPLDAKRGILAGITGFAQTSVCEDVPEHWTYWRDHFNPNPDDCCNLKFK